MPCSSLTRHAGESVSRCGEPHGAGALAERLLHPRRADPCIPPAAPLPPDAPARPELPRDRDRRSRPTSAACRRTRSAPRRTHSSTRSYISSTSTPCLRKTSRCGLLLRGGVAVGGDVVDRVLPLLHPADVVGERHGLLVGPSLCVEAKRSSFAMRSWLPLILDDAFLERAAELLPERRVLLGVVARRDRRAVPSTRLTDAARIVSTSRDCCRISRETLSGRSLESMTPRTKRRYAGISCSASSMMKTRRTYSLMPCRDARGPTGRTARAAG